MPTNPTPPLLTYRFATNPTPLQADGTSRITISVLKPKTPAVYCKSIQISVPKNDVDGNAYFAEEPEWSYSSANWEPSSNVDPGDDGEESGALYWRKKFTSLQDGKSFDSQFDIGLKGTVSNTGPLACEVLEMSATSGTAKSVLRKRTFTLGVEPQTLFINNFLAFGYGGPTVPKTKFQLDEPIGLAWESNGTHFVIYDGSGKVVFDDSATECILQKNPPPKHPAQKPPTNDTTYTLRATLTPGSNFPNNFEPIYQYATVAVTITNPILTGLTVTGDTELQQKLTVTGDTELHQKLTVSGNTEVQSGLTADYGLTVKGTLTVSGYAWVQNGLDVDKSLRLDTTDVMCYGKYQLSNDRYGDYGETLYLFRDYSGNVSLQTYDDSENRKNGFNWYLRNSDNQ
ncbi:hypothetical protein [Nocardia sp. NPDC005998]|uniref:hypothetical protein n=1 Tax=Nocardia sp. NPDC005998 TaxID=3156894 RepID=UPI00339FF691